MGPWSWWTARSPALAVLSCASSSSGWSWPSSCSLPATGTWCSCRCCYSSRSACSGAAADAEIEMTPRVGAGSCCGWDSSLRGSRRPVVSFRSGRADPRRALVEPTVPPRRLLGSFDPVLGSVAGDALFLHPKGCVSQRRGRALLAPTPDASSAAAVSWASARPTGQAALGPLRTCLPESGWWQAGASGGRYRCVASSSSRAWCRSRPSSSVWGRVSASA